MRVALLPTGRTEWHGLPQALQALFPEHEFYALPDEALFRSQRGPYASFTSSELTARSDDAGQGPSDRAAELVGYAAQAARGDRRGSPAADVVIVLEDLELSNRHQPDRVVRVLQRAVGGYLDEQQGGARSRVAALLRERVSFHLVVPMIEAWFFGDPAALRRAGVPPDRPGPFLNSTKSLEDFETMDAPYEAATTRACPEWLARGEKKADRPKWLGNLRHLHPKGYLQWLCLDGGAKNCTSYDESRGGAAALAQLDWGALLEHPGLRYLGALLEDLADALGEPMPRMTPPGPPPPATSLRHRPEDHVLRNL